MAEPPADAYQRTVVARTGAGHAGGMWRFEFDAGDSRGLERQGDGRRCTCAVVERYRGSDTASAGIDLVENRLVGIKSREIYEAPAATILHFAHTELERLTLDKSVFHMKNQLAAEYANLVYNGLWFSPLREALDAFVNETQKTVTGTGAAEALQGERGHRRTEVRPFPVQREAGDLHRRRHVRPQSLGRIHHDLRIAGEDVPPGEQQPPRRSRESFESDCPDGTGIVKKQPGRFRKPLDPEALAFSSSLPVDRRLYREDIEGSIAHVTMLARQGSSPLPTRRPYATVCVQIRKEIESGRILGESVRPRREPARGR